MCNNVSPIAKAQGLILPQHVLFCKSKQVFKCPARHFQPNKYLCKITQSNPLKKYFYIFLLAFLSHAQINAQSIRLPVPKNELHFIHDSLTNFSTYPVTLSISDYNQLLADMAGGGRNRIFNNHLLQFSNNTINGFVNPVIGNTFKFPAGSNAKTDTELGLHGAFTIGKKLSWQGIYSFNRTMFAEPVGSRADTMGIIPHHRNTRSLDGVYFWHHVKTHLLYQPLPYLTLQAGMGKNFYGNGYRSMFLSDHSGSYPYVRADVNVWKIRYSYLLGWLQDVHAYSQPYEIKSKFAAFHYLTWNISSRIQINAFETVVWAADDSTINRGLDINYLNPVIFFRPVEFSTGSPDNVMLGIGANVRFFQNIHLYGQFLLDEFNLELVRERRGWWGVKFGYQAGVKFLDLLHIPQLYSRFEINTARPFTYAHSFTSKSYGNYLQPLAHPLESNFIEILNHTAYSKNRWRLANKFFHQRYGFNKDNLNYGNNIYVSSQQRAKDYNNVMLQPEEKKVIINDLSAGYLINPFWHFEISAGYLLRFEVTSESNSWSYFYIGLRTNLTNHEYWDGRY